MQTTNLIDHAGEIRRHHDAVHAAARTAIEHALAAGRLLAEVKGALGHGGFESWVAEHCNFTARTARRYMQLHAHRESLPAGAGVKVALAQLKTDTVSEMKSAPAWLPPLGEAVIHGDLMESFWIVRTVEDGYASAMAFVVDEGMADAIFTKRPIRQDWIADQLKAMELPDPDDAEWRAIPLALAQKLDLIARETVA
jgi:hypothetical protein